MVESRIAQMAVGHNKEVIYTFLHRGAAFSFAGKTFTASPSAQSFAVAAIDENNKIVWSQEVAGKGFQGAQTTDILVAPNGDIFLIGHFTGEVTIGNQTLKPIDSSAAQFDQFGFIAKLNAKGEWQAAQILEVSRIPLLESPSIQIRSMALASNGDLYLSGSYQGKLRFLTASIENNKQQAFVLRVDSLFQNPKFTQTTSTTGSGSVEYTELIIDENDKTYLLGQANGEITFGAHKFTPTGSNNQSGFLLRFDLQAADPWVMAPYVLPQWYISNDLSRQAIPAVGGGVVWVGAYEDAFQIGSISRPKPARTTSYLASMDANGNMRWLKEATGPSGTRSIFVSRSPSKEILWIAEANDAIQFGSTTIPYPYRSGGDAANNAGLFFNDNGDFQRARTIPVGELFISGLQIDIRSVLFSTESVLMGGGLRGQGLTLYGTNYRPVGIEDVFLLRIFLR